MAVETGHRAGRPAGDPSDHDATTRFLRGAGIDPHHVVSQEPVSGGTYNTLYRLRTVDGSRLILKIPPPEGTSGLQYEHGLIQGEITYYRALAGLTDVPVPRVVHAEPSGKSHGPLLMTECPGTSWSELSNELSAGERSTLRHSLGRTLARAHTVTSHQFGYPAQQSGPPARRATSWREAFTVMLNAVLEDAERYSAWLPRPVPAIRKLIEPAASALDEVVNSVPVHFDLWEGNILLDGAAGRRTVSGIVDGERMFWGDPLAELPSLLLFGRAEDDPDLMAGYRAVAEGPDLDGTAVRTRLALYRCYLYLIMLVETVPRASTEEVVRETQTHVAPALLDALDSLSSGATRSGDGHGRGHASP
ncbi:MAG TPA: aminoglycoside phosphotransferase family protein [Streptomyces sp.]|nr:aminoglycoside phosphotransferase family protein [Streptomyces sp.]